MNPKLPKKFELLDKLVWYPELGFGTYPVKDYSVYDKNYFEKYASYEDSDIALALNRSRCDLVMKYMEDGSIMDVGIGSGSFILSLMEACVSDIGGDGEFQMFDIYGTDVNPAGVEWLKSENIYREAGEKFDALTFWDSLEHIHDPALILSGAEKFVFASIPIFDNADHVLRSKHFRKDEHVFYFTIGGFENYMREYGFKLVEFNRMEQAAGREDIGTFVFKR